MTAIPALFLSPDELKQLTGRAWPCKQAEWLRQNNIPFFLNAMKRPVVSRAAIIHNEAKASPVEPAKWSPAVMN